MVSLAWCSSVSPPHCDAAVLRSSWTQRGRVLKQAPFVDQLSLLWLCRFIRSSQLSMRTTDWFWHANTRSAPLCPAEELHALHVVEEDGEASGSERTKWTDSSLKCATESEIRKKILCLFFRHLLHSKVIRMIGLTSSSAGFLKQATCNKAKVYLVKCHTRSF